MDKEYVWAAMYNPMVEESTYGTISLHKTKRGAEMAIEFHKNECRKEYDDLCSRIPDYADDFEFAVWEDWLVQKIEIFE